MAIISGGILAGGKSTRMGIDKATILYKNDTFLQHAINLLQPFTNQIFVSSNINHIDLDYSIVPDIIEDKGPIGGVYSLLKRISTQKLLIVPIDTPLLNSRVIAYLLANYDENAALTVCRSSDGLQMLVGVYDISLIPLLKKQMEDGVHKMSSLIKLTNAQVLDVTSFSESFINVNTKLELNDLNERNNSIVP